MKRISIKNFKEFLRVEEMCYDLEAYHPQHDTYKLLTSAAWTIDWGEIAAYCKETKKYALWVHIGTVRFFCDDEGRMRRFYPLLSHIFNRKHPMFQNGMDSVLVFFTVNQIPLIVPRDRIALSGTAGEIARLMMGEREVAILFKE